MTRSIVVFLGPSVPLELARQQLEDAIYLPPVAMGDVYRSVQEHAPWAIGIIDGFFEQQPAVWHKEVLFALSQGVRVYGAASMGALRAAELRSEGMIGVGEIFQAFARGELEDDDEVAVAHAPADQGYRPLSDAMVEIRDLLCQAERESELSARDLHVLECIAKSMHYAERSWPAILRAARGQVPDVSLEALSARLRARSLRLKSRDALALLDRLRADRSLEPGEAHSKRTFEATSFWHALVQETALRRDDSTPAGRSPAALEGLDAASPQELFEQVSVLPERDVIFEAALNRWSQPAGSAPEELSSSERARVFERLRRERRLKSELDVVQWRRDNRISAAELASMLGAIGARERALALARKEPAFGRLLVLELKQRGWFHRVDAALRMGRTLVQTPATSTEKQAAVEWYQSEVRWVGASLQAHAAELGIAGAPALVTRLVAAYRCRYGEMERNGRAELQA